MNFQTLPFLPESKGEPLQLEGALIPMLIPGSSSSLFSCKGRSSASFQSLPQWLHGNSEQQVPQASEQHSSSILRLCLPRGSRNDASTRLDRREDATAGKSRPRNSVFKRYPLLSIPLSSCRQCDCRGSEKGPSVVHPSPTSEWEPSCASPLSLCCEGKREERRRREDG